MKVLLVHPYFTELKYHMGGSEVTVQDTYNLLKAHGHEPFFFATDEKPYLEENYKYSKYFIPMRDRRSILNKYIWGAEFFWNSTAQRNIEKYIKDIKPDIVHIHVLNNITYSVLKPCFNLKLPVVMTIHDAGIVCPTRKAWNYETKSICMKCKGRNVLPCIAENCSDNKKMFTSINLALKNLLEKMTGYNQKIDAFITPSQALKDLVSQSGINTNKISVVPPCLSEDYISTTPTYTNNNYFVFVGAIYPFKGVQILLNAMKRLPRNVELHIVGKGNDSDLESLKDFVNKNSLNVKFLGTIKNCLNEYSNSIATIVPSDYFEGFGLVNTEAMACGKPVIASKVGGISEIIDHEVNGFLFEQGNDEELAKYMIKLWQNRKLALEMGKRAREKAVTVYSRERFYEKFIYVYEQVLKRKG